MRARPGVALMVVLWVIVFLSTITTGIVLTTRSNSEITGNYRAGVVARYAAESGITAAVATLEDSLAKLGEGGQRLQYVNRLERALGPAEQMELGAARFAVQLVDVAARLDINAANAAALTRLFSYFGAAIEAENSARAIRAYIERSDAEGLQAARTLESLEEAARIPGVSRQLLEAASRFLTVDGDGTINRMTASDTVMSAVGGDLRDEPSRILVVSRGWQDGHKLTHEIQAVYALNGARLTLVRWRERDL
jgi:type II secretory pathway component PulK